MGRFLMLFCMCAGGNPEPALIGPEEGGIIGKTATGKNLCCRVAIFQKIFCCEQTLHGNIFPNCNAGGFAKQAVKVGLADEELSG